MLTMKKACELCVAALAADGVAWICSYECTYCSACHQALSACPNCGGELALRPRRTTGAGAIAVRVPGRIARTLRRRGQAEPR